MTIGRRTFLIGVGGVGLLSAATLAGCSAITKSSVPTASSGGLVFDPDGFTELTKTITTASGDKEVVYHFFSPRPYVSNPVDDTHQSLIVSVPVSIDGVALDAANAPIVFASAVGGYFPASVAEAKGIGEASMEMAMGGGGGAPTGMSGDGEMPSSPPPGAVGAPGADANAMIGAGGERVNLPELALAAGFVVVEPGCRGRTLVDDGGTYYGVAPAPIVDLKAALRYLSANTGVIPGDTSRIITTGTSAGGALSALLGASGDSALYADYLKELGAADGSDAVFASADWCPIADLENADMAYEWNWGSNPLAAGTADATATAELSASFADYQGSLALTSDGFGTITTENYGEYLLATYLQPAATTYLAALSETDRTSYLSENTFIRWDSSTATFTWADYLTHVGARKKSVPAFDAFDVSSGENNVFGLGSTGARHFTTYSAERDTSGLGTSVDSDISEKLRLMNPMHHLRGSGSTTAEHWWVRVGTKDTDTALTVVGNLVLTLQQQGIDVNGRMYWDSGHGSNDDVTDFITWLGTTTGYSV